MFFFNFDFVFKNIYSSFTMSLIATPRYSIFNFAPSSVDVTLMNGKFSTFLASGEIHFCKVKLADEMKCSDLSFCGDWFE